MIEKTIKYKGSTVYYRTVGNGEPLLLLHGFGEDGNIWSLHTGSLAKNHLLIIPDVPGSGRSDLLNIENTSIDDYAAVVKSILDHENIRSTILVGHSMGGYIGLAFAEKYPEQLSALGLFHSTAYADDEAKKETRRKAIDFIQNNGALAFLKTAIPGLFFDADKSSKDIDQLITETAHFSEEALIQYYEAMISRPQRTHVLKNSSVPVLFVAGVHDKAVPYEQLLEQTHLPNHAYVYVLRNSAHMGMLEEPGRAAEILAIFLESAQSRSAIAGSIFR